MKKLDNLGYIEVRVKTKGNGGGFKSLLKRSVLLELMKENHLPSLAIGSCTPEEPQRPSMQYYIECPQRTGRRSRQIYSVKIKPAVVTIACELCPST
jgi:hypothetical protein